MTQAIIAWVSSHRRPFLYFIIGVSCVGLDWVIFCIEIYLLNISAAYANFISSHIAILASFILNSRYNFKVTDYLLLRFAGFYCVGFCGYLFGHFFLKAGMAYTSVRPEIIKAFSYFGIYIIQFTLNSLITFGANMQKILNMCLSFLLQNQLYGLPLPDKNTNAEITYGICAAISNMEHLYMIPFFLLTALYALISFLLHKLSVGRLTYTGIFLFLKKMFPFSLLIKWLRSFHCLSFSKNDLLLWKENKRA